MRSWWDRLCAARSCASERTAPGISGCFSQRAPAALANAAFEAAGFPAGETRWCLFLDGAGHEAIDQLFVQVGASISIAEAFSTALRKDKTQQNKCSLQPLMVIAIAAFSGAL